MRVSDILKAKGTTVFMIKPDATIAAVVAKLKDNGIGAILVSASGASVDGIISERDVAHGLAEHGAGLLVMPVAGIMNRIVVTCSPLDSVADVAAIMTAKRIRHLPVWEGRRIAGIISIGDVLKSRLEEMQLETSVLRDYAATQALGRGA